jgi:hypothetical protein
MIWAPFVVIPGLTLPGFALYCTYVRLRPIAALYHYQAVDTSPCLRPSSAQAGLNLGDVTAVNGADYAIDL